MDCRAFVDCLADLVQGTLRVETRREAEDHARSCSRCGDLLAAWTAPLPESGRTAREEAGSDFTRSVLARTSGSSCSAARDLLPGYADGDLEAVDTDLVRAHLHDCAACREVASVLEELTTVLGTLGELDPGPGFTTGVLQATSARDRAPSLGAKFEAWWNRLVQRPRLGFEFAYAGTLLLVLVLGNPAPALQAASERTLVLAQAGLEDVRAALPSFAAPFDVPGSGQRGASVQAVAAMAESVSAAARDAFARRVLIVWQAAAAQYQQMIAAIERMAGDALALLNSWWASFTGNDDDGAGEPPAGGSRYQQQEDRISGRSVGASTRRRPDGGLASPTVPDDAWSRRER